MTHYFIVSFLGFCCDPYDQSTKGIKSPVFCHKTGCSPGFPEVFNSNEYILHNSQICLSTLHTMYVQRK